MKIEEIREKLGLVDAKLEWYSRLSPGHPELKGVSIRKLEEESNRLSRMLRKHPDYCFVEEIPF